MCVLRCIIIALLLVIIIWCIRPLCIVLIIVQFGGLTGAGGERGEIYYRRHTVEGGGDVICSSIHLPLYLLRPIKLTD